jgi:hypothetical protein
MMFGGGLSLRRGAKRYKQKENGGLLKPHHISLSAGRCKG